MLSSLRLSIISGVANAIPNGVPLPIVRGHLKGCWWLVGAAAGEAKGLSVNFNLSEPSQMDVARQLARPDKVAFDIGANVGAYTLLLSKFSKHVVAFEPSPRNVSYLYRMVELNRLQNVTLIPAAVSSEYGWTKFRYGSNNALGCISFEGEQPVATISLDVFVQQYGIVPHLVKIDVEGAEADVLLGAKETLKLHKPDLLLSVHSRELRERCLEYLRRDVEYTLFHPLDVEHMEGSFEILARYQEL